MRLSDKYLVGLFRKLIFREALVEPPISFFFSDAGRGRPAKELYTVFVAILSQQIFDLCDKKTLTQIAINTAAIHSTDFPIKRLNPPLRLSISGEEKNVDILHAITEV